MSKSVCVTSMVGGLSSLAVVAALVVVATGCGPTQSTAGIIDAEGTVEQARVHDAGDYSPYEYTRARLYLHKAHEEWGYSNFEAARDYALEARRAADAALNNTHEAPWQGHPVYGLDRPEEVDELEERLEETDDIEQLEQLEEVEEVDGSDDG